ncbi:unnamed protein product [Parajaminaea phylloscopi]
MADAVLDYGDPDARAGAMSSNGRQSRFEDERNDAEAGDQTMASEWDQEPDRSRTSQSPSASFNKPRMIRFPDGMAVAAGANRGPTPLAQETPIVDDHAENQEVPPTPQPIGGGADVRLSAINLSGTPIAALSTSRLFAYVSHFGAQPLGVEWINDTSVNIVFADAASARLALEYICPDNVDPALPPREHVDEASASNVAAAQGLEQAPWPEEFVSSCIQPRKAHRFPQKLYNALERDLLLKRADELRRPADAADETMASEYPDDVPAIYRELEEQDKRQREDSRKADPTFRDVQRLLASIWARYALESVDFKDKNARHKSGWYKEHGKDAGKSVVSNPIQVGEIEQRKDLITGSVQEAAPASLEPAIVRDLPPHMTGRGKRGADHLAQQQDSALLRYGSRRSASPVSTRKGAFEHAGGNRGEGGSQSRRSRAHNHKPTAEELDAEMDAYLAGRSTAGESASRHAARPTGSASAQHESGSGSYMAKWDDDNDAAMGSAGDDSRPKVRGRGRHKAPSSSGLAGWGRDDDGASGSGSAHGSGGSTGGMYADDVKDEFGRSTGYRARNKRGRGAGGGDGDGDGGRRGFGNRSAMAGWDDREYETASSGGRDGHADTTLAQRLGSAPGQPTLSDRLGGGPKQQQQQTAALASSSSNRFEQHISSWD